MKAFILAEHDEIARCLASGARSHADEVIVVSIGCEQTGIGDLCLSIDLPEGFVFDDAAETLITLIDQEKPHCIFAETTRRIKAVIGRVAAHYKTAALTGIFQFADGLASSLYFGGVAEQKLKATGAFAIYVCSPGLFNDIDAVGTEELRKVDWVQPKKALRLVAERPLEKTSVDLNKADVIVAAGRGFAEESDLELARNLAAKVGGELGCTRPLTEGVDWLPRELYIGVSGLMLAPKVYIGVGVSGQMQHMVGCNRAGTIIAINKDKNAPIFRQCDYGIVGDIKNVLPTLTAAL